MPVAPLNGGLLQRALEVGAAAHERDRRIAAEGRQYALRFYGDPLLTVPATPIDTEARYPGDALILRSLATGMRRICAERRGGVAIAAQQVGATLAVILTPVHGVRTVMVNPRIVTGRTGRKVWSRTMEIGPEGCLSVPDYWTNVERHTWVTVEFTPEDLDGRVVVKLKDFEARAVQHELDHLAGRCIVDGATRQQRRHAERCVEKARRSA
jgi:peptide deformylase